MILDTLGNAAKYAGLKDEFSQAFGFLDQSGLAELPDGRHAVDGDQVFAIVARESGRKAEDAECNCY